MALLTQLFGLLVNLDGRSFAKYFQRDDFGERNNGRLFKLIFLSMFEKYLSFLKVLKILLVFCEGKKLIQ